VDQNDEQTPPATKAGGSSEAEERFRALTEHSTDPISEIAQDRSLVYVSPGFTKTFGYAPEEVLGQDALKHVHPDDIARVNATHSDAQIDGVVSQLSFRYRHKNGSWRWVELTGCPYRTSSGEIRAILINRDITDRVAVADELKLRLEAEQRIEELSRYFLSIGINEFDQGIQQGLRSAAEITGADRVQFYGLDPESESLGKFFQWNADGIPDSEPSYSEEVRAQYQWSGLRLMRGEKIVVPRVSEMPEEAIAEREALTRMGVRSYFAIAIRSRDKTVGVLDFFTMSEEKSWSEHEITRAGLLADILASALRRQRSEVKRHQTKARFQTLAEHAGDSICELGLDWTILYASPRFSELSGYSLEELNAMRLVSLIHPDDRPLSSPEKLEDLINQHGSATVQSRVRHRNGGWRWIESTVRPFSTPSGERRYVVVIRDVTDRKQQRSELEQQLQLERRLAALSRELLDRGADEIDEGIRHVLAATGELAGADRCWLVSARGDRNSDVQNFEWCADGIPPRKNPTGNEGDRDPGAWVAKQLADGDVVKITNVDDLPEEARRVREGMTKNGIQSFLAVPIRSGDSLFGVLGFHAVREKRDWTDHEVNLYQIISGMFTSALRRKRAEVHLRESEERFRALTENAKDSICEFDRDGAFLYASPSFTELLGFSRDEILGLNLSQLIHPSDLESMREQYGHGRLETEPQGTLLYRVLHKDGHWVVLEGTATVFDGASGEKRVVAVLRDVTERQRVQQTLERQLDLETRIAMLSRRFLSVGTDEIDQTIRESLADLTGLAESDRSWLISFDWKTGETNDVFEWHSDQVPSHESDLFRMDSRGYPWTTTQLQQGHVIHIPSIIDLPNEAEFERRSLTERGVKSFLGIPLHSENAPVGILGFETTDREKTWTAESITLLRVVGEIFVTALRRRNIEGNLRDSQQQLMQAQKMEAVGTLAGGIAHDFNNQLTVMLGNARYVLRQLEDEPDLKDALTDLNRAAEHCAQLTRSLLAFSRRSTISPQPLDPEVVVTQVQELLRPLIPNSIDFEISLAGGADWVEADSTQLQQVLLNLAINARDAMPDGGSLIISAHNRAVDSDDATRIGLGRAGDYVELGVMDTGTGIDPETLKRIFEPFYTTKPLGQGTGLGLATAYGIVTETGGAIEVDTAIGRGTTFRVLLPVARQPRPEIAAEAEPEAMRGSGKVLVVEDEAAVRRFIRSVLERAGFDVVQAEGGAEALELVEKHGDFDAVVTDIDMPRMTGIELARNLDSRLPDVPILFLSGSSRHLLDQPDAQRTLGNFLQKPFGEEEIVDELLRITQHDA
jgi:PAS domain S-box-containing protein